MGLDETNDSTALPTHVIKCELELRPHSDKRHAQRGSNEPNDARHAEGHRRDNRGLYSPTGTSKSPGEDVRWPLRGHQSGSFVDHLPQAERKQRPQQHAAKQHRVAGFPPHLDEVATLLAMGLQRLESRRKPQTKQPTGPQRAAS